MKFKNHLSPKNTYLVISIIIILLYIAPYFIFGRNSHIRIHDNLDSNVVMYKILVESGKIFGGNDSIIPNIMNGLPRSTFFSEYSIVVLLYYIFGIFYGYIVNQVLVRIVAFAGMYLLLKNHVFGKDAEENAFISVFVSLCFSLIPFFPHSCASIGGIPLILNSFFNIQRDYHIKRNDGIVIIIFPFISSLVLSGIFIIFTAALTGMITIVKQKRFNYCLLVSLVVLSMIYLLVEYRLVLFSLSKQFISHRTEFSKGLLTGITSFTDCMRKTAALIVENSDPPKTFPIYHKYFIQFTFMAALLVSIIKNDKKSRSLLVLLFISVVIIAMGFGFYYYKPIAWIMKNVPLLNIVSFWRFIVLLPFLWYIIFAVSLRVLHDRISWGKYVVPLVIILQILYLAFNSDEMTERMAGNPSFREFYSTELFNDIKQFIGKDQSSYRVASIGFHPSISLYNGFYTIDGYCVNYPLEYKKRFRTIIAKELAKNKEVKNYFDNWGSRCYLFTAELPFVYWRVHQKKDLKINMLELDSVALKDMGCHYIISAVEIVNYRQNHLMLIKEFEKNDSPYKIGLYQLIDR